MPPSIGVAVRGPYCRAEQAGDVPAVNCACFPRMRDYFDVSEVDLLQVSAAQPVLASTRASGSLAVLSPAVLFQAAQQRSGDLRLTMRQPSSGGVAVVVFRGGLPTMVFLPGDGRSLGELMLAAGDIDVATLDGLVNDRSQSAASLEQLLQARSCVPAERVQRLLDFQARARLLDVLAWHEGFFELQDYVGGGETAFRLDLPGLDALAYRAQARAETLPRLLARLPASPANTVIRRRRGGVKPLDQLGMDILAAIEEPLLLPQIVARLLVDDDLVVDGVLRLAEGKVLAMQPRVALAPPLEAGARPDPRLAAVVREVLARTRGLAATPAAASLSVVVVAATAADGVRFVTRLGAGDGTRAAGVEPAASTGLASRMLELGDGVHLCLLAIRPEALSRGALEGILARFDALVLVRTTGDAAELDRLQQLRSVAHAGAGHEPLTVGVDLGATLRDWQNFPDAVLGLTGWEERSPAWLVERLVDALLAATAAHRA